GRDLLCQPAGAEGRPQREGGVAILQFRGAGQAPGGLRDAVALRAGQSRRARADDACAAAAVPGLARERKDSVQARRRLDRAAAWIGARSGQLRERWTQWLTT